MYQPWRQLYICLLFFLGLGSTANTWITIPTLNISYLYHDECFSFTKSNAQDICQNTHGGDGVASAPTTAHWNAITSVVNSTPTGSCEHFNTISGSNYIGMGATSFDSCTAEQKEDSYTYWNGDTYSNIFDWNTKAVRHDCTTENGLHFIYSTKKMDDAPWKNNYATVCYKKMTISPTPAPTDNPTNDPTLEPTDDPTLEPTDDPTIEPTTNPSPAPTDNPTNNPSPAPTNAPSISTTMIETTKNCEVIGLFITLNWNITSSNYSLYSLWIENNTRFNNVVKNTIYTNYDEKSNINNDIDLNMVGSDGSLEFSNMNISYNITNCNIWIKNLVQYLNSTDFMNELEKEINDVYYPNITGNIIGVQTHSKKYHSFLPEPIDIDAILHINNPITIVLLSIILLLLFIIFLGCIHNHYSMNGRVCCGFKIKDNFKYNRIFSYLFDTTVFFITLNILYGYFYCYTLYDFDKAFLAFSLCVTFIILIECIVDTIYIKTKFPKDLEEINVDESVMIWYENNLGILILFTLLSNGLYSSLCLVNSQLFGMNTFCMNLSNVQLYRFRKINKRISNILGIMKLCIYIAAIIYIFVNKYGTTIKWFTIITIIVWSMYLLSNCAVTSKFNNTYVVKKFHVKIVCDDKNDIEQIQRLKGLTEEIQQSMSSILETQPHQIEILTINDDQDGIMLICMVNDISINVKNKKEYMEPMLSNKVDHIPFDSLIWSDQFKRDIKKVYHLNNEPSDISYETIYDLNHNKYTASFHSEDDYL